MAWKKGPLPADTYNWGGVVPCGENTGGGFLFADFKGDHVVVAKPDGSGERIIPAKDVLCYDNSLELPPPAMLVT